VETTTVSGHFEAEEHAAEVGRSGPQLLGVPESAPYGARGQGCSVRPL